MENTARDLGHITHLSPSHATDPLPSWRTLLRSPFNSRYNQFYSRQSFSAIKNERSALSHRLAANLMNLWPDQTSDLFNRCPWDQLIDILVNQCAYNHQIKSSPSHDHQRLKAASRQRPGDTEPLMMTDWTAHRRGALVSAHAQPSDGILLIEDPHLLSLALARRGFTRIAVASRDADHLDALLIASKDLGLEGRIVPIHVHDTRTSTHPVGEFALSIVEAPADAHKALAAIDMATQLNRLGRAAPVMVSLHLMGLLKNGLKLLSDQLSERGMTTASLHPGLNGFALPFWSAKRLQTLGRMATGMEILSQPTSRISYFVSDAMILRYGQQT